MSKREQRLRKEIGTFLRQYARKAEPNHDPNDRHYSREIEALVKRMSPREFDDLVNGSEDDMHESSGEDTTNEQEGNS